MKNCKFVNGVSMIFVLHNQCNLNCKFCVETDNGIRKPSTINLDYIKNLPNTIIESINPVIKNKNMKNIEAYCIGGELLSDNISDEVFDSYEKFFIDIRKKLYQELNLDIIINLVSNGVFTKYDRVEKLIKHVETFSLSYDPCDRFSNDIHRQMWNNTFNYFQTRNINLWISTVLTKRNINAYIAGDEIFNQIPSNILIEIQEYVPRLDYHDYLPSDDDIYNFYKWCIDHEKFNVSLIRDIIGEKVTCNGGHCYMFLPDLKKNYINYCIEASSLDKNCFYGNNSNEVDVLTNFSEDTFYYGLNKRGCLYCEYHGKCPTMCFIPILLKDYQITECPIKRVYQYIEDNPSIMDKYQRWEEGYKKSVKNKSMV